MRDFPRFSSVGLLSVVAIGAGLVLGLAGWPQPGRAIEFCGLILAAILTSALVAQPSGARDLATMPLSFVIDCTSLLLLGPHATMIVVTAGTVAQGLTDSTHAHPVRRMLRERRNRVDGDTGRGPGTPGARRHDGALRVAGTGRAHRGRCCRVLLRQVRPGGSRGAARRRATGQSIVADWLSAWLSELLHRGQPRRGTRRGNRPPQLARGAGSGRALLFRVPRVCRSPEPARRRAPPPGGHRRRRPRHVCR